MARRADFVGNLTNETADDHEHEQSEPAEERQGMKAAARKQLGEKAPIRVLPVALDAQGAGEKF